MFIVFLTLGILNEVTRKLKVILILISLRAKGADHIVMHLLATTY